MRFWWYDKVTAYNSGQDTIITFDNAPENYNSFSILASKDGRIRMDSTTLINIYEISFEQFIGSLSSNINVQDFLIKIRQMEEIVRTSFPLNDEFTAEIHKGFVRVRCQEFKNEKIRDLVKILRD